MDIKQLYDEMRTTWEGMKSAMETQDIEIKKHGESSQETKTQIEAMNGKITTLQTAIKDATDELTALQAKAGRPGSGGGAGGKEPTMSPEQKAAFEKYVRYGLNGPTAGKAGWLPEEQKALSEMIDSQGGYLVPPDFANEMIEVAQNIAQIRSVAKKSNTSRAELEYSKLTQRATVAWGNESIAVSPQDLALGLEAIPVNELTALVLVPNTLLEDAESNVWSDLTDIFGKDMAFGEDLAFSVGDGNKKPEGLVANKDVQARAIKSGAAATLTDSDVLLTALYNNKIVYRRNATWAMNSTAEALVRKMKDNYGQYLWAPGLEPGRPAHLLGRPVINPEGLPDIAAGTFPIVIGDFSSGYRVVDRRGVTIQRLVERYAEFRQTGFLVTKRVGGQVVLAEAFTPIQIGA